MAYVLDALVLVVFGVAVWAGFQRGFVKTVTGVVAFLAAAVIAALLSGPVAQVAYDNLIEPATVSKVDSYVQQTDTLETGVDKALTEMPPLVTNALANSGIHSGADVVERLDAAVNMETAAREISDKVVQPVVLPMVELLVMLLLFILVYIVARLLLGMLDVVAKLPLLKQMNKGLGLVAGAVSGLLWALFAVSVLQVIAAMGAVGSLITPTVLGETTVTAWLIGINPAGGVLRQVMGI